MKALGRFYDALRYVSPTRYAPYSFETLLVSVHKCVCDRVMAIDQEMAVVYDDSEEEQQIQADLMEGVDDLVREVLDDFERDVARLTTQENIDTAVEPDVTSLEIL